MSSAFVVGATGAVGLELVKLLGENSKFTKVALLTRRNVDAAKGEKFIQKIVDFEKLEESSDDIKGFDVGFCALGTTKAKSGADGFYKVDHDYVLNSAKLAKDNGVKTFVLVSSNHANEKSFFYYLKVKGEVEREIEQLGFEKCIILRPAAIEATREQPRLSETIGMALLKPLKKLNLANNLTSTTTQIASAMIVAANIGENGTQMWSNARIIEEAKKYDDVK